MTPNLILTDSLTNAFATAGMPWPGMPEPGKYKRFSTNPKKPADKSGWLSVFPDGDGAVFGCWREGSEFTWQRKRTGPEPTPAEREAWRKQADNLRKAAEAEREREYQQAAEQSRAIWQDARPLMPDFPYLVKKGIKPHIARIGPDGRLIVPVRGPDGEIQSLAHIAPDGEKRFHTGGRMAGGWALLGTVRADEPILLAEGFATAATLHEATGKPVFCAFNAGNMGTIAAMLQSRYPGAVRLICGDDDRHTEGNPGRAKATAAADATGARVIFPKFTGASGSDFNDLAQEAGPDAVRRAVEAAIRPAANDEHTRQFAFVHVRELVHHVHAPAWLIPGYLESDTLTTLTAAPKSFKSFMALDWSCCIATGKAWNGRPVKQGAVFLIVGEGFGGIGRRLAAWSKHFGQSLDDAPLFVSTRAAALTDTEAANDVLTAINALHDAHGTPALIVVDTLARNFGGEDENSTPAMNRFVQAVDTLRGNAAALIVHHMGHNATRSRGSSALLGAIDFGHQMAKLTDGTVRLLTTEAKDHEETAPIEFGIEVIELDQVDHEGNPLSSVVLIPQAGTGKPSAPPITPALRTALEALAQAAHDQGSSKGADVERWRDAFYSTSTADDTDTKRRAFNRARKTLTEKGLATVADDFYSSHHEAFTARLNVLSLMRAA